MKQLYFILLFFGSSMVMASLPHKTTSVLATGSWYKIAVKETGIHKITYENMVAMGIDVAHLNPSTIRVFGNGGGMLPENNSGYRFDDLRENAIVVVDGNDGKFDQGDYVLFYGESPDKWTYSPVTHLYTHAKNLYADDNYYFITTGGENGKRVTPKLPTDSLANTYSRRFDDFDFHEIDSISLIKSGRIWYGEVFDNQKSSYDFHFIFPNIDTL